MNKDNKRNLIVEAVGERLRAFRKMKDFTLAEFCVFLDISATNLSKIERGERGMTETMLHHLCKRFADFDPRYILTGEKSELKNGSY